MLGLPFKGSVCNCRHFKQAVTRVFMYISDDVSVMWRAGVYVRRMPEQGVNYVSSREKINK